MKRFVTILMLFVYSLSISGMAVQLHFCDGNISSLNLISKTDGDNCCCSTKEKQKHDKSCCGETTATFKISIDQSHQQQMVQFKTISASSFDIAFWNLNDKFSFITNVDETKKYIDIFNDIGKQKVPLYKLFSSLVYYG